MFQTYDSAPNSTLAEPRVKALRDLMSAGKLDAYLVPRADEHQGEYVPASSDRLKWLTGFSGSAGIAIIAHKKAALIVDGRYTVQVRQEADAKLFEFPNFATTKTADWLRSNIKKSGIIGFDPRLHTIREITNLTKVIKPHGLKLKATPRNLVDRVWGKDRPSPPEQPVTIQPLKYAGQKPADKLANIQNTLQENGQSAVVLTQPDSICWLFNIRGSDIAHNPVALAFAIVPARGRAELFISPKKIGAEVQAHLKPIARTKSPEQLKDGLRALRDAKKPVRLDPGSAAWWFEKAIGSKHTHHAPDPCTLPKAKKNAVEIRGARAAHVRDGVAMVRFLAWLDEHALSGKIDEITAARQLETFRSETGALKEISFDTISGAGPNGAIVHYRVSEASNRKLKTGELYLVDSGAQYIDGTTDITRTIAIGKPSQDMRRHNTAVLKGHIAIATACFPVGTRGVDLDALARRALWQAGLDYDHGTGHGVGSYLSVHEGPASISKVGMVPLEPGMVLSNEPGYYREGAYGIRIENLILVNKPHTPDGGDRAMLSFETLTLAPIDQRLIAKEILTADELAWLNNYHAAVLDTIAPELDDKSDRTWLQKACAPL